MGQSVKRPILLNPSEADLLEMLGRQTRLARLRRRLSQDEMADKMGIPRKAYAALETGSETTTIGLLLRALTVLGYPDRLADLLAHDPLGEDLEKRHHRPSAVRQAEVRAEE